METAAIGHDRISDRRYRREIGVDGQDIVVRHLRVSVCRASPDRAGDPSRLTPLRTASSNCSSVQAPMPVSASGVMFGEMMLPKGVSMARPPANGVLRSGIGMAAGAVCGDREITALFNLREILRPTACAAGSRQRALQQQRPPRSGWLWSCVYASTSRPGFLRYFLRIAFADQNASAATVPVGL